MTDTTKDEKLQEFQKAWMDALTHYPQDMATAGTDAALRHEIDANKWKHQANWALAATAALEKNSPAVSDAFEAAKTANRTVAAGRKNAAKIAEIVSGSASAASALADLLKKASQIA